MNAELGLPVSTSDGHGIGPIDALIVERETRRVRAVVVREGLLVRHRVRVPVVDLVVGAAEDLRCRVAADDVGSLPAFGARQHAEHLLTVQSPTGGLVDTGSDGRSLTSRWSDETEVDLQVELEGMLGQTDADNVVVGAGAQVVAPDNSRLGRVERITFDLTTGEIGSVTFHGGFLGTAEYALPGDHVTAVDDDRVMVDVARADLERMSVSPS